jgi:hypothetical protein
MDRQPFVALLWLALACLSRGDCSNRVLHRDHANLMFHLVLTFEEAEAYRHV